MSEHNNMHDLDETADKTVAAINKVDAKVTEMRQRRMADPDTLGDKALKMIIPSLAGLVGGRPTSVSGMSVRPVYWPDSLHSVWPWRSNTRSPKIWGALFCMVVCSMSTTVGACAPQEQRTITSACRRAISVLRAIAVAVGAHTLHWDL